MTLQVSKRASGLTEQHAHWCKWEKVQCEVTQGHRRSVKTLAVGWIQAKKKSLYSNSTHTVIPFLFFYFFMIFIEVEGKMKSCRYFQLLCVDSRDGYRRYCWWVTSLFYIAIPASFTSTQWGQMKPKRPVSRKIGAKCVGFRCLTQGSVSLSKS